MVESQDKGKKVGVHGQEKGFTLIELLVVISVIALLLAILMPALYKAKELARQQVCRSNLRGIGFGILMYLQVNDYKMPNFYTPSQNCNGHLWYDDDGVTMLKPSDHHAYWGIIYKDYVQDIDLFGCPSFWNFNDTIAEDMLYGEGDIRNSAFSMNGWLTNTYTMVIKRQSEVIVSHDHMEPRLENGNDMLCVDSSGVNLSHYRQGSGRSNWYRGIFRHVTNSNNDFETGGRLNCLWLDGHVNSINETLGEDIPKRFYDPLEEH